MKNPKILIIEDSHDDFKIIINTLNDYEVSVFPDTVENHYNFAKDLSLYAKTADKECEARILNKIDNFFPNILILDIGIDFDKENDRSGINLLTTIEAKYKDIFVCICTKHNKDDILKNLNQNKKYGWIYKRRAGNIPGQIKKLLNDELKIPMNLYKTEINKTSNKKFDLKSIINAARINFLIEFIFRSLLLIFTIYPIWVFYNLIIVEDSEPIVIAENCFVVFLPLIIISGFFVFYKKVLSPIFVNEVVEEYVERTKKASMLINLGKKLFISSFISYVSINLIENLENATSNPDYIFKIVGEFAILIFLFIYLIFLLKKEEK